MFHDIVKAWAACVRDGRLNNTSGRQGRASRRFVPQVGSNGLEMRLAPSTTTFTPTYSDPVAMIPSDPTVAPSDQISTAVAYPTGSTPYAPIREPLRFGA